MRVAGYVVGVLVSLAAAALLVRHLGVAGFGRYVTVTSLVALVGGVTEAGIYVYGIREYGARSDPDRRELMANLLAMRLTLSLVGVLGAACFAAAVGYAQALVLGTLVVGAGLLVQVMGDVLSIPLQAQLRLGRLTLIDLTRRVLALVSIATLVLAGAGLLPLLAASPVAAACALALLAWTVRASLRLRVRFDRQAWRRLFAESSLYAIAMSIGAIYFYVTVLVMSLIASVTQTGLFSTSFRVIQVALGVPVLLLTAIFPLMAQERSGEQPAAVETFGRVFTVALICGVWMTLATALGAGFIVDVIAGRKGHAAVSVLQIQAIVLTVTFISTASALGLIALRRYRVMIVATTGALALDVALGLALIPSLGARGGALADVITEALVATGMTAALMRAAPRHELRASVVAPVLLAAGLGAATLLLPVSPLARAVVATLIYFAALLLLRAIPVEVTDAARGVLGMRKTAVAVQRSS